MVFGWALKRRFWLTGFPPGIRGRESGIRDKDKRKEGTLPHALRFKPHTLMFAGAMDYRANVDGIIWFCKEILPEIMAAVPETQFYIVGGNPTRNVRNLGVKDGIKVTGFVEDVRKYYQMADVCLVPLRIARGVQNKILEAMAMERPVVSTSMAVQGIDAANSEHLLVADDPEDFAALDRRQR